MIIAITGPSGAGKTSVAELLVKRFKNSVNIDVDPLKHMNPNAFIKVINDKGEEDWPYLAWGLLGENTALLVENYIKHGHDVIINGWLEVEAWLEIEKRIKIDHKILLMPEIRVNIERDAGRTEEVKMGERAVLRGRDYFKSTSYYHDFVVLDTANEALEDTVKTITEIISNQ
jgi:guanylate kinase